jgi:RNA polymerase sigma-70 factor (ECF subfamily)
LTENTTLQTIKRWLWKENEHSIPTMELFARLYEETHLIVFRYVYGLSGGPRQEAEDLTAETYARAWKTRQGFRGDKRAALNWLLHIARNLAIDLARRRKVRNVEEGAAIEVLEDPHLTPETDVITREQITLLWRMLGTLSDEVREILVLRYILGWQVKQIATYLDIGENNVSVTIRRALKNLQRNWPQEKDHE